MRLREAVDIYDNLDIAANEIRLVYKNFTIDHIDIFETKKKYFKLYSSDGSMEKKHANNPISESPISIPA